MIGMHRQFERVRAISPRSIRGAVFGWIGACCVLLAILAIQQFVWIGRVSDHQRRSTESSLYGRTEATIERFRDEIGLFLWMFQPDHGFVGDDRSEHYLDRYRLWHGISKHGSAVKRILLYDPSTSESKEVRERFDKSRSSTDPHWDENLALVHKHIDEFGIKVGRRVSKRWTVSWIFHPRSMAIYRPTVASGPVLRDNSFDARLTGYLILQLDQGFIRDHLLPEILSDHLHDPKPTTRYFVTVTLDGESLYVYESSDPVPAEERGAPIKAEHYSYRLVQRLPAPDRSGPPDLTIDFPLLNQNTPTSSLHRGVVQRISLRTRIDLSRLLNPPTLIPIIGLDWTVRGSGPGLNHGLSVDRPRLFVAADEPHRLAVELRHQGSSLDDVINQQYKRSVAIGIAVIVLLVGAMAMVAISARNATALADLRLAAVSAQSHHLLNPLAGISILAENMARGMLGAEEKLIGYGLMIREYGQRINQIVDRTMGLAAKDSPFESNHLVMLDVSTVASDALEDARPSIESAGFVAECSYAKGLPMVRADADALRQCLSDLLSNALKYGLPERWIKVETCEAGSGSRRRVLIRVCDRGRGIPSQEAWKIFEPYYRVDTVANSAIPGFGLGLALVRTTVETMGGKLTVASEEGRGSVFTIHFPAPG